MSMDLAAVIAILAVCALLIARSIKRRIAGARSPSSACSCCGVRGECDKPEAAVPSRQ